MYLIQEKGNLTIKMEIDEQINTILIFKTCRKFKIYSIKIFLKNILKNCVTFVRSRQPKNTYCRTCAKHSSSCRFHESHDALFVHLLHSCICCICLTKRPSPDSWDPKGDERVTQVRQSATYPSIYIYKQERKFIR